MKRDLFLTFLIVLAVMLAGCTQNAQPQEAMPEMTAETMEDKPAATDDMTDDMADDMTDDMADDMADDMDDDMDDDMTKPDSTEMMDDTSPSDAEAGTAVPDTGEMSSETMSEDDNQSGEDMMEAPTWFDAELTDVRTGDSFRVEDLQGKVVLVETMAMWCPKCLQQQRQVVELNQMLGMRDDFVVLALDVDPNENAENLRAYVEQHGFTWLYAVAPADVARELASLYGDQYLNPSSTPMLIIDRHGEVHLLPFGSKDAASLYEALQPYLEEGM